MDDSTSGSGRISTAEFRRAEEASDWRVTPFGPEAVFTAGSFSRAAELVPPIAASADRTGIQPDVDLRPEGVVVRIPADDNGVPASAITFAASVSQSAVELGLTADPSRVQSVGVYVAEHSQIDVRPFFQAALGYAPWGETDAVDPLRRGPQLAFNPITGDAPGRGRTHFDVFVPADQAKARVEAAIAAGGRLADDSYAPSWWSLASPDNHGVDIAAWPDASG